MVVQIEGEVIRCTKTRRGPYVLTVLVRSADGKDVVSVFSAREYKPGSTYKGTVESRVNRVFEVGLTWEQG